MPETKPTTTRTTLSIVLDILQQAKTANAAPLTATKLHNLVDITDRGRVIDDFRSDFDPSGRLAVVAAITTLDNEKRLVAHPPAGPRRAVGYTLADA